MFVLLLLMLMLMLSLKELACIAFGVVGWSAFWKMLCEMLCVFSWLSSTAATAAIVIVVALHLYANCS